MAEKIENMMDTTINKIKEMVDTSTIVGEPITLPDGVIVIPVSKLSYGFASGGSDIPSKNNPQKTLFGGGAGAGVTVTPVAFITVTNGNAKLLQIDPFHSPVDRALGMAPDLIDKVNGLIDKIKENKEKKIQKENSELISEDPTQIK